MKQILIVEDDSFLNKMVAYNLTADGYGVTSALNARTAAEAIRQREFDLVLLDINLPDGNGFELCKLIKPQHPDTIVIFLTANDQESDQIRGYEVGAVVPEPEKKSSMMIGSSLSFSTAPSIRCFMRLTGFGKLKSWH